MGSCFVARNAQREPRVGGIVDALFLRWENPAVHASKLHVIKSGMANQLDPYAHRIGHAWCDIVLNHTTMSTMCVGGVCGLRVAASLPLCLIE